MSGDKGRLLAFFFGWLRKIIQRGQPEVGKEGIGRAVQNGAPQRFFASDLFDQSFVDQGLNRIIAFDTADGFDVQTGDRLTISNDRKRFQSGLGKGLLLNRLKEFFDVGRVISSGGKLHMGAKTLETDAAAMIIVFTAEIIQRAADFRFGDLKRGCQSGNLHRLTGDKKDGFDNFG